MSSKFVALALTVALAGGVGYVSQPPMLFAAKCVGRDPCGACTSCRSCAHCKKGGTCGVCKPKKKSSETALADAGPMCEAYAVLASP